MIRRQLVKSEVILIRDLPCLLISILTTHFSVRVVELLGLIYDLVSRDDEVG